MNLCSCGDRFASVEAIFFLESTRQSHSVIILAIVTAWSVQSIVPFRMVGIKLNQQKLFGSWTNMTTTEVSIDKDSFQESGQNYIITVVFTTKFTSCVCFLLIFYIKLSSFIYPINPVFIMFYVGKKIISSNFWSFNVSLDLGDRIYSV